MKKLLSALLTISIIMSVILSATANISASESDTSDVKYLISDRAYEELSFNNGYIYGFIGDADSDGQITVLDTTAIQLHLAQHESLDEDEVVVADVDFDEDISIMDATEIQLWVAQRSDNRNIAHTLYIKYPSTDPLYTTFDELAQFIIENRAEHHASFHETVAYFHNDEYNTNLELYYKTDKGEEYIQMSGITNIEGNVWMYTDIHLTRGETEFNYYSQITEDPVSFYDSYGSAQLISLNPDTYNILSEYFSSRYYDSIDEVGEIIATGFSTTIEATNIEAKGHISGDVRNLFYATDSDN